MPFFEPEPEPIREQSETQRAASWAAPAWDRPSEGTLPAVVAVSRLFARTENVALALDEVRAYPNGFVLGIALHVNPRIPDSALHPGRFGSSFATMVVASREAVATSVDPSSTNPPSPPPPPPPNPMRLMLPRLGVQFSDGRRAGDGLTPAGEAAKDADGFPTGIVVRPTGGGGGSHGFRWGYWVYPLPSPGALDVFAEWSRVGIREARITLDADEIRSAAERAMVLWS